MGAYYLDSSALIKRYNTEPGSVWIQALCNRAQQHQLFIARITSYYARWRKQRDSIRLILSRLPEVRPQRNAFKRK
jgi:predicted nucleic acid-binding protein